MRYDPTIITEETRRQYQDFFKAENWEGNYKGNRLICKDCANYINNFVKDIGFIYQCKILNKKYPKHKIDVMSKNNICRYFKRPSYLIKHYGELNFNDYLEYLRDCFYGGCCADKSKITNSNNYVIIDGTKYYISYIDYIDLDFIKDGQVNCCGYWQQMGKSKWKGKNVYLKEAVPFTLRWLVDNYNKS